MKIGKRIKKIRASKGWSQEKLSEETGVSLRTIQRIENGESEPRGDTLNRIAIALNLKLEELIEITKREDKSIISLLHLSALGFLFFPLLGIILPLALWVMNKDKVVGVEESGKKIINFQITWTVFFCSFYALMLTLFFLHIRPISFAFLFSWMGILYILNIISIANNFLREINGKGIRFYLAFSFLK